MSYQTRNQNNDSFARTQTTVELPSWFWSLNVSWAFAGQLISESGLKGYRISGVEV